MRDIADPASPYAGQYGGWDRWYFDHALRPRQRQSFNWASAQAEPGFVAESVEVDAQGFVIPRLLSEQRKLDELRDLGAYLARPDCVHTFSSAGAMPAALHSAQEQARLALWAAALPKVPDWLAQSSRLAIVLPDGRAVTAGPSSNPAYNVGMLVYRLHDAGGAIRAEAAPGLGWQDLLCPGYTERYILAAAKAGCRTAQVNGYTVWLDSQSNAVRALYDYDGTALTGEAQTAARQGGMVTTLYPDMLKLVYAAQQELR